MVPYVLMVTTNDIKSLTPPVENLQMYYKKIIEANLKPS